MTLTGDVVITGACGAIGSNLVRRVLKDPVERVICIDNLSAGYHWLLPSDPRVEFHEDDVEMEDMLWGAEPPQRPVVFHLAAHFANQRSVEEPLLDTYVNVAGTVNMLELAKEWSSPLFVFAAAGCAVAHEDTPYQISKTSGEAYCRYYARNGVPTAVYRFHNSYGPGELPGEHRNVVPRWIWAALNKQSLTIFGDGSDTRDFVYVDDVVEALVHASPSMYPRPLGTGKLTTIRELFHALVTIGGVNPVLRSGARRAWDHRGGASDFPIGAACGEKPPVPLDEGLRRTWAWFRENEQQIRDSIKPKG